MAKFNKFDSFAQAVAEKKHNLSTDTLKVLLTNVRPAAANSVKSDIVEIAAGNGYPAGGQVMAQVRAAQTGGKYKLAIDDTEFVAKGGSIEPFRWAVLYNATADSEELIGSWDYGSEVTLGAGETILVEGDRAAGVLTLGFAPA